MLSRKRVAVTIGIALFVFLMSASIILHPMFGYPAPIKYARWLIRSHHYKAKVLAEPSPANGELKHIEWDGWGWGGMDTTVYLVFDPTDSLSRASGHSGKYAGLPCEVALVKRLEDKWYTVQFYTDQDWRPGC